MAFWDRLKSGLAKTRDALRQGLDPVLEKIEGLDPTRPAPDAALLDSRGGADRRRCRRGHGGDPGRARAARPSARPHRTRGRAGRGRRASGGQAGAGAMGAARGRAAVGAGRRRQRRRQDDHGRQAGEARDGARPRRAAGGGRHFPRRGPRAAREWTHRAGPRSCGRSREPIRRRSPSTASGRARPRRRRGAGRHGGPASYEDQPHGGARQDATGSPARSRAPHEMLLVLDATTGQNGLAQAREFHAAPA